MKKVIKHGKLHEEYTIICEKCGCEFSYSQEDTELDSLYIYFVSCPECHHNIRLGENPFL